MTENFVMNEINYLTELMEVIKEKIYELENMCI
jgi:hypothetical protein